MSLKKNIFINCITQVYIAAITLAMLPIYIRYMGAETYGLVGFFTMMQTWFILIDMGLTLTVTRETAYFRGGTTNPANYLSLIRTLEKLFLYIAVIGGGILFLASTYIAHDWLQTTNLSMSEIKRAIKLMAGIISLRWMSGLYRGAITGFEQLVWLGGYNSFIATLRFIGAFAVLAFIGTTPTIFFSYQLAVASIELIVLIWKTNLFLPKIAIKTSRNRSLATLKPILKFSLSLAFPTITWVFITQTDKLVLSKILSLSDYGYFTLAVMIANSIIMINEPISTAILPRMTKLEAQGDQINLINVYRNSTQIVTVFTNTMAVTIVFYSKPLLWSWTGNELFAAQTSQILVLYAIGNAILCICAFPFYLQYAKGNLRMHLIGNAIFFIFLIPAMIWAAQTYGAIGTGYIWILMNLISFIFGYP